MDLSENKEHPYLNALKIPKNTVIGSVATPVARDMVWTRAILASQPIRAHNFVRTIQCANVPSLFLMILFLSILLTHSRHQGSS